MAFAWTVNSACTTEKISKWSSLLRSEKKTLSYQSVWTEHNPFTMNLNTHICNLKYGMDFVDVWVIRIQSNAVSDVSLDQCVNERYDTLLLMAAKTTATIAICSISYMEKINVRYNYRMFGALVRIKLCSLMKWPPFECRLIFFHSI